MSQNLCCTEILHSYHSPPIKENIRNGHTWMDLQILLQKLNVKEIAERLERELAGKDIDDIVRELRKELNEKVRSKYTDLLT